MDESSSVSDAESWKPSSEESSVDETSRISANEEPNSEIVVIPSYEQKLRSEIPVTIVEYANRLKIGSELNKFTQQIRDAIWGHFEDENTEYEQLTSNRLVFNYLFFDSN